MLNLDFLKEFFAALYPEHHYVNIKSPLLLINMNYILIGLYVGIVIALSVICYRKNHMGKAIRAIIEKGALSEESALTAEELGLAGKRTLISALRREKFGSLVKTADSAKDGDAQARYYIPEDRRYEAENRYSRRGSGIGSVIIWAVILIPVFMFLRFIIPELLQLLDNFITSIK